MSKTSPKQLKPTKAPPAGAVENVQIGSSENLKKQAVSQVTKPKHRTKAPPEAQQKNVQIGGSENSRKQAVCPGAKHLKSTRTPPPIAGENVQISGSENSRKQAVSPVPKLIRTTFRTSRAMDFFSEKELVTQVGHEIREWPLVIIKELIDNALDACEEADISPELEVIADEGGISVRDNGPGLPEATLQAQLDFAVRVSSREMYVSPSRGSQGNALKTLLAMPVVLDPDHGKLIVEAHDKCHVITCGMNPISQRPEIHDDAAGISTTGTKVRIEWAPHANSVGDPVWPFGYLFPKGGGLDPCPFQNRFLALIEGFAIFNPHATIRLNWFGTAKTWKATRLAWEKWKPHKPTSSHWYELPHLERLIGAYITLDQETGSDRLVSDFLSEFDGLARSNKQAKVLNEAGLKRVKLSELVVNGQFDRKRIVKLLSAMQQHTRPVKSKALGIIGEDHFRTRLLEMGVQVGSFRYLHKFSKGELPCVIEAAFGWLGESSPEVRRIYSGANWSAAINNPFRAFGATGEGLEAALSDRKVGAIEPVVFVLHVAHPRIEFTDRGKSALIVGDLA